MKTFRPGRIAKEDLADIRNDFEPGNPSAADRLEDKFFDKFHLLAKQPGTGTSRPEFAGGDIHVFPVDNDVIFYCPIGTGIEIARLDYGGHDFAAFLFD